MVVEWHDTDAIFLQICIRVINTRCQGSGKDVCAAEWRCEDAISVVVGGAVVEIYCVEYDFGIFVWSDLTGRPSTKLDSWLFLFWKMKRQCLINIFQVMDDDNLP